MTFPFWVLFIPYGLYLALCGTLALVDVYHMVRFGTFGMTNFVAFFCFLAGVAIVLWATAQLLIGIDWARPLVSGLSVGQFVGPSEL